MKSLGVFLILAACESSIRVYKITGLVIMPCIALCVSTGDVNKRSTVSVSQLAALLHNLRSRDLGEEGVKLQSLRFGK
jgi:hypothetical protein